MDVPEAGFGVTSSKTQDQALYLCFQVLDHML